MGIWSKGLSDNVVGELVRSPPSGELRYNRVTAVLLIVQWPMLLNLRATAIIWVAVAILKLLWSLPVVYLTFSEWVCCVRRLPFISYIRCSDGLRCWVVCNSVRVLLVRLNVSLNVYRRVL